MPVSDKARILIDHCIRFNGITTSEANNLLKGYYFLNHQHYVSEILSRLVKSGRFVRVAKGQYIIGSGHRQVEQIDHPKLFGS